MGDGEKRVARRKAIALRIKLRYDAVDTFIAKFATNISRAGLFIRGKKPKPVGTEIRFELQLADGTSVVKGRGEVRWVRPYDPDAPKKPYGMGIEFTMLDDESREMIERIVSHRAQLGHEFEPSRIPHRLPTEPPPIAEAPSESTLADAPRSQPLQPEKKKRPRATLEEVLAQADAKPQASPTDDDVEGEDVSLASVLERARQITEVDSSHDALLDELEAGGGVVAEATPEEASARLAALFGDLPVRRKRNRDVERGVEPEPKPASVEPEQEVSEEAASAEQEPEASAELANAEQEQEASAELPNAEQEQEARAEMANAGPEAKAEMANAEREPEASAEPPNAEREPEASAEPPNAEQEASAEPESSAELANAEPEPSREPEPSAEPEPGPDTPRDTDANDLLFPAAEGAGNTADFDEPTRPSSVAELDAPPPGFGPKVPALGSFANETYEARTVARPDLAAALANAAEVLAEKDTPPASPETDFAGFDGDVHNSATRMAPNLASAFGRNLSQPELDEDIEAALDALIPDSLFGSVDGLDEDENHESPVIDLDQPGSIDSIEAVDAKTEGDLEIGDSLGFHRIETSDVESEADEEPDEEPDEALFPPIGEPPPSIPEEDYVISFGDPSEPQPSSSEPEDVAEPTESSKATEGPLSDREPEDSPEPDATFARAQKAIDEVIGEFDDDDTQAKTELVESLADIDLSDHLEIGEPGSEAAPTYITDMPSAALASDLVHDTENELGGGRELESLLPPAEPFLTDSDGPVHGIGDFFDPQPLSEEVGLDEVAKLGPPPIPKPPPVPVRASPPLGRPPDTIPPGDLRDEPSVLRAPGMPELPEEDIDIDISLDEFDESPKVSVGDPIPAAVTDAADSDGDLEEDEVDEDTGEDTEKDGGKKKGIFGRLFRKSKPE